MYDGVYSIDTYWLSPSSFLHSPLSLSPPAAPLYPLLLVRSLHLSLSTSYPLFILRFPSFSRLLSTIGIFLADTVSSCVRDCRSTTFRWFVALLFIFVNSESVSTFICHIFILLVLLNTVCVCLLEYAQAHIIIKCINTSNAKLKCWAFNGNRIKINTREWVYDECF